MQNSKLIHALKTFSPKEMREFNEYVNSPYFNNERPVMELTEILKKVHPKFDTATPTKEEVYKKLYPGKKYNDSVMRNVLSKTLRLAENFLTLREFENNTDYYRTILNLRAPGDRNLPFLFSKARENALSLMDNLKQRDSTYYYLALMYEDELRRFEMRRESKLYLKEDNIQNVANNMSFYIATELMRTYAVMLNLNKHNFERKLEFGFMEGMLKAYEDNIDLFKDIHYANLYYNSIKLFITEDEQYFNRVREISRDHYETLPDIDRKNAYVVQINYCAEMVNKGKLEYMKKKLAIYKEILERKAHYEGQPHFSHVLYNGIAFAAINQGELKWAKEFIETYREELTEMHRENSYNTVMSEYYLKKGDTDKALGYLAAVKRNDPLYKEEVYFLLLKIFYSAGMTEQFYSEIDSFRNFIKESTQISERRKNLAKSFVSLVKKLYSLKLQKELGQEPDVFSFRKEVLANKYVSDKFWLLDKVNELEIK